MLTSSEIRAALKETGLSETWITKFLKLSPNQQSQLLNEERPLLLNRLHVAKNQLDCLDYLRYQFISERTD